MPKENNSDNKIIRKFNDKVNNKYHKTEMDSDEMFTDADGADRLEASSIKSYTAKINFAKNLKRAHKLTNKQYLQARIGLKGELASDLASAAGMRQPMPDASDMNDLLNDKMDWLHAAAGSQNGNHMSHIISKYYSRYKAHHPHTKNDYHQTKTQQPKNNTKVVHHIKVVPVHKENNKHKNDSYNQEKFHNQEEDNNMNHMNNTTNSMNQRRKDLRIKQAFTRLYHTNSEFHNQVNLHMESQEDRQLQPVITPHIDTDLIHLHDGSMATRQTRRIYKDYSNHIALNDYRSALNNYLYTKKIGVRINHNPGETDTDPNPHMSLDSTDSNIISNEVKNAHPQQSAEAHNSYNDEFYVNSAKVDPFWTRKAHRPYVKMDSVHRTDINQHSPLAGHYVTTYIDNHGNMHHSQIIPGHIFNNILRANGRQPYTMGDFVHSIGHRIATKAMGLVFRAKTFASRGLKKVRGKFSGFINVASIKASRFKLNVQREINMERHLHHEHILAQKAKIVNQCKHPYDAFNFMSPREMREAFGSNPRNYHWGQDFQQTQKRNSIFNRVTPEHLDRTQGPSWRPGYNINTMFRRHSRYRSNQQSNGFEL